MPDNKKGNYRKRNKDDPANVRVNFKLRQSQKVLIDATHHKDRIPAFLSDLVDDFFVREELDNHIHIAESMEKISARDAICMIGNKIDGRDVAACLHAWLDGSSIPPIKIGETGLAKYKQLTEELQGTAGEAIAVKESLRMLELVRQFYWDEKGIHLNFCELSRKLVRSGIAKGRMRKATVDRVNSVIDTEYSILYGLAILSPQIKFSTFLCMHKKILHDYPAEKPAWAAAVENNLKAMNQPWIDPDVSEFVNH